jgi:hypothetical protein
MAIIFFPGILATIICDKITTHVTKWGAFKYTLYSFFFGVSSYIFEQIIYFVLPQLSTYSQSKIEREISTSNILPLIHYVINNYNIPQTVIANIIIAVTLSPIVAIIFSFVFNKKIVNIMAMKFKVSEKYGDESLYYLFSSQKNLKYVVISEKDKNLTYQGKLSAVSITDYIQEIILIDVKVYNYETSDLVYSSPSIYLSKPPGGFTIEYPAESHDETTLPINRYY